jgi:hypothetical protein
MTQLYSLQNGQELIDHADARIDDAKGFLGPDAVVLEGMNKIPITGRAVAVRKDMFSTK